jgi:hypothetical protein
MLYYYAYNICAFIAVQIKSNCSTVKLISLDVLIDLSLSQDQVYR